MIVISVLGMKEIMVILGATDDIVVYATDYYRALLFGLPFMGLSLVYFHQLNAQGEIRIAMQAMIISTTINIALDYVAIYVLELGVAGAAYATAISQVIWYGYMHIKALKNKEILTTYHPVTLAISIKKLWVMMGGIGFGTFVRHLGMSVALILINSLAGDYGSSIHITAFGATQRIIRLFIAPIAAINTSLKPIIGQNYGQGAYDRIKEALTLAFKYSLGGIGVILLLVMILLRNGLGSAFGIEPTQMETFTWVLLSTSALFPLYGVHHLTVSYFMSLGKGRQAVMINLLKQVIILIPLVLILPPQYVGGLWSVHCYSTCRYLKYGYCGLDASKRFEKSSCVIIYLYHDVTIAILKKKIALEYAQRCMIKVCVYQK